ncbi:Sau3AI family type II restriction endonuclease [Priestia megaterium]|uniref:Sau3AI family type II restriction endonuclease n=1 Tax=Priestia megaterium TaxID=1404 RepID=UPI001F142A2B|nr:Sau3AI family type II restriction endonuclease [Priestia megaterium]UMZ35953.1 restriction endonuclease [Priestia megaterium]
MGEFVIIYKTYNDLIEKAQSAEGKTFREIDIKNRLSNPKAKGGLGQVIEESFFGLQVNSAARPDFQELGIELKVTPFKHNKNGTISAKERLVLNIINYIEEVHTHFYTSSFWKKNENLLLMFYEWLPGIKRNDYRIYKSILFTYPEADLEIIKQDWKTIISKIKAGKAHELSESDTNYLGAAPKGVNKSSLRIQPNSEILAMQRAFSLKQSYMTALVRKYIQNEKLISFASAKELKKQSLEEILTSKFAPFLGLTDKEIAHQLDVAYNQKSKSFVPSLVSSLLGIKGTRLDKIEEFAKANIQFKTIRLEPNGKPKESMSFENVDFNNWISENWIESYIRKRFYDTKFLFVVFEYKQTRKENRDRFLYFKGIKLWNMPVKTIENEIKQLWEEVVKVTNEGIQINYVKRGEKLVETNNLPKRNFNGVAHIRPKAINGSDKVELPDGERITKQCYWLNNTYVAEIISTL